MTWKSPKFRKWGSLTPVGRQRGREPNDKNAKSELALSSTCLSIPNPSISSLFGCIRLLCGRSMTLRRRWLYFSVARFFRCFLARVVGHVPSRAFELDCRRREQAHRFALHFGHLRVSGADTIRFSRIRARISRTCTRREAPQFPSVNALLTENTITTRAAPAGIEDA